MPLGKQRPTRSGLVDAFLPGRVDECVIIGIWHVTDRQKFEVTQEPVMIDEAQISQVCRGYLAIIGPGINWPNKLSFANTGRMSNALVVIGIRDTATVIMMP